MESETFQDKVEDKKRDELFSYVDDVKDIIDKESSK